jgi:hypothetical protein
MNVKANMFAWERADIFEWISARFFNFAASFYK